jgi:uncharacterized protein
MRPFSLMVLAAAAALASRQAAFAQAIARQPVSELPHIEAVGDGEVRVAPDRATITLAVETKGAAAATVASQNARIQRQVLDTLRALGFGENQISTLNYNVGPNYEPTPTGRRQVGYIARNAITVRLTDLERIGAVIDAALARGATQVQDVAFESSRADSARRVALAAASAEARADAEAVARAMGGSLGPLIDATTSGQYPYVVQMRAYSRLAGGRGELAATQITPSAIEVTAVIGARWRFLPTP